MTTVMLLESDFNLNNICRLCLSSVKDMSNIFKTETESTSSDWTLADKIQDCTSVQMHEEDGLPCQICSACHNLVDTLHNFKRRCINSDLALRDYLLAKESSFEIKPEPIEITQEGAEKSEQTDELIETQPPTSSPPPDCEWESQAVDVEVKVEITENVGTSTSNAIPPKNQIHTDKTTVSKDRFPCSQCNKVFAHKNSLTRHEASHSGAKFICMFCNKRLTTRDTLLRHVKAHSGNKQHRCEYCGKSYTSSTSYSSHIRKHTGERPFKCPECNETFSLSSSLDRHIVKHRGKKEFVCGVCDAAFWVADDLRSHVNRKH